MVGDCPVSAEGAAASLSTSSSEEPLDCSSDNRFTLARRRESSYSDVAPRCHTLSHGISAGISPFVFPFGKRSGRDRVSGNGGEEQTRLPLSDAQQRGPRSYRIRRGQLVHDGGCTDSVC